MNEDLLRFNENQKYIVFDFETCNANTNTLTNIAWQLGLLICEGSKILKTEIFYLRWPNLPISKGAARVTRFDWNVYKQKAVDPLPVWEYFNTYLFNPEYKIIGHNILGFDIYVYNIWCQLLGKKTDYSFVKRFIDTDALARGLKNDIKYRKEEDFLIYQYKMGSIIKKGVKTNLAAMANHYKIEIDPDKMHDAGVDVTINFAVWNKMKWEINV